jgi:hypothetical protein
LEEQLRSTSGTIIHSISLHGKCHSQILDTDPGRKPNTLSRYALAAATSVMLWMVVKKPPADIARRVRQNKDWS